MPMVHHVVGRGAWSPDGQYLAVADYVDHTTDIFVLPLDDQGMPLAMHNITRSPDHMESAPAWSRDQQRLAYGDVRSGYWAIFVMEVGLFGDDREPMVFSDRRVSQHEASLRYKGYPVWSPDGTLLTYTSDVGSRWQLTSVAPYARATMPLTGTEVLVPGPRLPANITSLAWSPDGTSAVFSANPYGNWDLFLLGTEETPPRQITTHGADDWNPAWAPDGSWIAFTSNRSSASDIFLITPDGAQLAQVTATAASEDFPAWVPTAGTTSTTP